MQLFSTISLKLQKDNPVIYKDNKISKLSQKEAKKLLLHQGWAIIFVRGPHCVIIYVSRTGIQSKRLI